MDKRNLAIFFPDDTVVADRPPFMDVINTTPFGWERHCRDIFDSPQIEFDLLSGDINFSEDHSDPDPSRHINNAWGLVHALAGLARRQADDGHGNQLPLVWEVRSVTPDKYRDNDHATRLYGLLRLLAAAPRDGEQLEACLWREYEEQNGRPPDMPREEWNRGHLREIMITDLAGQKSRSTNVGLTIEILLPRWRSAFLQSLARHDCVVNHRTACQEYRRLLDSKSGSRKETIAYNETQPVILPISDRAGNVRYGIDLFSIFADRVRKDPVTGDHVLINSGVSPEDSTGATRLWSEKFNVHAWYECVLNASGGPVEDTSSQLANLAVRVCDKIADDRVNDLITGGASRLSRAMVFCFLCAHSVIDRDNQDFGCKGIDDYYGLSTHPHTWRRALYGHPNLFPELPPVQFGEALRRALKGEPVPALGSHWTWIKAGLAAWLNRPRFEAERKKAQRNAPALFEM